MESTNLLKILEDDPEFASLLQELGVGEWRKGVQEKIDERLLADDMLRTRVLGTTWGGGLLTIENPCQLIFSLFCR